MYFHGVQGHIINVSSIAAHDHYAGGSVYCGTKAFVSAFTNAMRHDLVGTNVRCAVNQTGSVLQYFAYYTVKKCLLKRFSIVQSDGHFARRCTDRVQ